MDKTRVRRTGSRVVWCIENWDDGYIRKYKIGGPRFMVYYPEHPRANHSGYVKRYYVVWWLAHNHDVPAKDEVIHHINENSLDDRIENLAKLTRVEHSRLHHQKNPPVTLKCKQCKENFTILWEALNSRIKEGRKGIKYCSKECHNDSMRGKTGYSRKGLTVKDVKNIRHGYRNGWFSAKELADLYKVSKSTIYAILSKQNWRFVD